MIVRSLNFAQFKNERQKIWSLLSGWQNTDKDFFQQNDIISCNSNLYYHWREAVNAMKTFLEKDITKHDESILEQRGFAFFIAEDEAGGVEGIALGGGISTYQGNAYQFLGIRGTFYGIEDMVISVSSIQSRCFLTENKVPHKQIGKELLKAIVHHVGSLDKQLPIVARPHHTNTNAKKFFEKQLFRQGSGSIGYSYTLKVDDFINIDKNIHEEQIAGRNTLVIDDYESLSSCSR